MFKKLTTYSCILLIGLMGFFVNFSSLGDIASSGIVTNTYAACSDGSTASPCPGSDKNTKTQDMLQSLVSGLNILLDGLTIIVSPAIILASWLMSPDWTSGDLFQIRPMIHDLWVTVANIAYFIYALLLVFIALATIFNSENYGYKQLLPKLALGIIMVPLTWWFVQFIISLATIVTASVISIPMEVVIEQQRTNASSWWTTPSIPKNTKFENDKTYINGVVSTGSVDCSVGGSCISPEAFIGTTGGMYSSLMIYSFAVFKFQDIKELGRGPNNTITSIGQIINQALVGAVMFIVFGLLVMALIFMLLIRAIKLWFYAIFSPLMTLKYVLGDKMFGDGKDSFDLKEFIGLAFVPALVGLALSFGLIIVSVMLRPAASGSTPACTGNSCTITLFGNSANTITTATANNKTETTAKIGDVSYTFVGDVTSGNTTGQVSGALNTTGGIIGTIIIDIIALVFIWTAFMAAKGVSKVAAAAFEPFENIGQRIGSMAKSLPKYAPIPGTGGLSANTLSKIPQKLESKIEQAGNERAADSKLGRLVGLDGTLAQHYARVNEALNTEKASINDINNVRKNSATIIAKKGMDSLEGQEAMENLRKIAMKDVSLKGKIESIELYKNGDITKAGLQLLEGDLLSSQWDASRANESDIKLWKTKRDYTPKAPNNTSAGFNSAKDDTDTSKINIQFNDKLRVSVDAKNGNGMTSEEITKLNDITKELTVDEFRAKFSISTNKELIDAIIQKAGGIDKFKKDNAK